MTYYHHQCNSYKYYEFTAFAESDLASGNLGCGTAFTMPASASVCLTVKDDDSFLSGDSRRDEQADDTTGQIASIKSTSGEELGNGGQIYGEVFWWVKDQHGNWYVMIEIEQEGTHDDYFTFYTGSGYGLPPSGAELTVHSSQNIVDCGWNPDFRCLDGGDKTPPTGSICGTVFCDTDCDGINGVVKVIPGHNYTIEAEKMWDCGLETFYSSTASGGKAVQLKCLGGYGELATYFDGKDGKYDVKIRVQDENDGQSVIKLFVDGKYVDAIRLDEDDDGSGNNHGSYSTYVIKDVQIEKGETIKLKVFGDDGEYVRIDKLDFKGEDKTEIVSEPTKPGVTIKLLALDGTVVAETTTDSNGNYKFDDVPVGEYKIMGVAPDGTEFTIQDAHGNTMDDIDSDVDSTGTSGIIKVTKDSKADIDLGVCEKENLPPEPQPDEACLCSDKEVVIDVLANDTDPEGSALTITAVDGMAIAEGETVTLASGAEVSLIGGQLSYDLAGDDDFDDLLIGETGTDSFTYTISDGELEATSDVDVGICGAVNTLETIANSGNIPTSLSFRIDTLSQTPLSDAYTLTTFLPGNALFDGAEFSEAYCLANDLEIVRGVDVEANVFIATESLAAGSSLDSDVLEDLDLINWILNQDFGSQDNGDGSGTNFTDTEIQAAVWELTDQNPFVPAGTGTQENVDDILDFAFANGEGYTPGEGDIIGLILDPVLPSDTGHVQPFIIGIDWDDVKEDCVCNCDDFIFT